MDGSVRNWPSTGFARRLGRGLATSVALMLAAIWGLFALSAAHQIEQARQSAISDTATLAKLVEAWNRSTLQRFDFLVASIETHLVIGQTETSLNELLARQEAADPDLFVAVELRDRRNRLVATSNPAFPPDSARNFDSDLPATTDTLIGLPRVVTGQVLIPVLHALHASDGRRLGSVVAEIDANYLAGFTTRLGLPTDASIILLRADGPLLASNMTGLGKPGTSYRSSPLWQALSDRPEGHFEAVETDGIDRVVSYRTSPDFPLVVAIGFAT
ncbi:MAG: hypothetical protein VW644_03590 [Alphaproteobacteria bacterium]